MIRFRGYFGNKRAAVSTGLDIDFTTGTLDSRITFARGSTATYYNSSGLVASAASGAPRFDYDPVTLAARGLLLEEQRTNVLLNSENFSAWTLNDMTPTIGATAPNGTLTASTISNGTATGQHRLYQSGIAAPLFTIYAKAGSASFISLSSGSTGEYATFDLTTGAIVANVGPTPLITPVNNGWYRCTKVMSDQWCMVHLGTTIAEAEPGFSYTGSNKTILIWGAQAEQSASFPTSYIPTTTVAVTRSADTAEMTGANFSVWYNASTGTFVVEYRPQSVSGTQPVISVNDTTANEAIRLYGSGTDPKAIVVDGGTTQADLDAGTITVNTFTKLGLAYTLNDFAASFDGGTAVTDISGTLPTVTQLQFHTDIAGNVANLHIKRLQFFSTRKSNSELQALTAPPPVGTGALAAQSATTTNTGVSSSNAPTNVLVAQTAAVASTTGISRSLITDTTLVADAAVVASTTGVSRSLITDTTLGADPAVVASTAGVSRSLITDMTIDAGVAAVVSTTGLVRSINTANTLAAQAAIAASTTGLSRSIAPSSALAPQRSTVSGIGGAATGIAGTGVLNVLPAAVAGVGLSAITGAGVLQPLAANSNGLGVSQFIGTGALFAEWADIDGLGEIPINTVVSGPYAQVGDLWEGAAVWGKIAGKWRRLRLWTKAADAWGVAAWDQATQEVDVWSLPVYGELATRGAHIAGAGFIRDQIWGVGDLRAGPALVTDSSSLSGLSVITNAAWEVTPLWVKANGKWRRATMWTNVSEEWKRVA